MFKVPKNLCIGSMFWNAKCSQPKIHRIIFISLVFFPVLRSLFYTFFILLFICHYSFSRHEVPNWGFIYMTTFCPRAQPSAHVNTVHNEDIFRLHRVHYVTCYSFWYSVFIMFFLFILWLVHKTMIPRPFF